MKLLIADDSAEMRRLLRSMLADLATEVVECGSGREAIELYFDSRPDWVLMDLHMQDVDGLTATREIRLRDVSARIAIVTQFDEEVFRQAARDAGAAAYILKENLLGLRRLLTRVPEL
ncbi:MAG TPA: response regulator [Thermoanaerobaculia bacterium]|nr:response regulator [Thermoanaerobaculia bacterium]